MFVRFSTCRAMRTMKCSLCRSTVHFGKHVAKCTRKPLQYLLEERYLN